MITSVQDVKEHVIKHAKQNVFLHVKVRVLPAKQSAQIKAHGIVSPILIVAVVVPDAVMGVRAIVAASVLQPVPIVALQDVLEDAKKVVHGDVKVYVVILVAVDAHIIVRDNVEDAEEDVLDVIKIPWIL